MSLIDQERSQKYPEGVNHFLENGVGIFSFLGGLEMTLGMGYNTMFITMRALHTKWGDTVISKTVSSLWMGNPKMGPPQGVFGTFPCY